MGPPGGARSEITQRYVRHFNVINVVEFSNASLYRVFGTVLDAHALRHRLTGSTKTAAGQVVTATVELCEFIFSVDHYFCPV